jgi:hypothetical protein
MYYDGIIKLVPTARILISMKIIRHNGINISEYTSSWFTAYSATKQDDRLWRADLHNNIIHLDIANMNI